MRERRVWNILCLLVVFLIGSPLPARAEDVEPGTDEPLVPYQYAYILQPNVPVYAGPGDPTRTVPVRHVDSPNTWLSVKDEVRADGLVWYRIEREEYLLADDVWLASPSAFRGIAVGQPYDPPLGFVVATQLNLRARPGVAPDNPPVATLSRYAVVTILGQGVVDGEAWYQIGPSQWAHSAYIRTVAVTPRPIGLGPDERWIAVNLSEQTLAAYEGDRMIFATLVSTGLPATQTPEGLFRIWAKLQTGKMSGGSVEQGNYYYLQDVPWTMYFHRGYGLHAAYWHDGFGYPRSRGCINLSPRDARWLFDWASPSLPEGRRAVLSDEDSPGTWVYVYSR